MATKVRGTQLKNTTIADAQIAANAAIATSKLADSANFIITTGANANTAMAAGYVPAADLDIATKIYVDTEISDAISAGLDGYTWQDSVLDVVADDTLLTPNTGDRYLVSATPTAEEAFEGYGNNIATYNGTGWDFTAPVTGFAVIAVDEPNSVYVYTGSAWVQKSWEATVAGNGLEIDGGDAHQLNVKLDTHSGLAVSANGLTIDVSGTGLLLDENGLSLYVEASKGLEVTASGLAIDLNGTSLNLSADGIKIADPGAGKIMVGGADGAVAYATVNEQSIAVTSGTAGNTFDLAQATFGNPEVFVNGIRLTVANDYSYSATGGSGGVSQLDFTAYGGLIDGDQLTVKYYYFAA